MNVTDTTTLDRWGEVFAEGWAEQQQVSHLARTVEDDEYEAITRREVTPVR